MTATVSKKVFQALSHKFQKVRENTRELLSISGYQTLGLDILQDTADMQEQGYNKLFLWIQAMCRRGNEQIGHEHVFL